MNNENFFPLDFLLSMRSPEKVQEFLNGNVFLDYMKKDNKLKWRNVGDDETNFRQLSISRSGVKAIIERLTNAMDSVLENEKEINTKPDSILPDTPREAINKWFEAKGGHISSIDKDKRREIAQKLINLNLYDSGIEKRPTVIVKDLGIGIHPDDFPTTILGLGGSLKRGKHYLLGAYGWGGSQTFLWCNGATEVINAESIPLAIIVSRKNPLLLKGQKDEVGWTIVRYRDTPNEKHGVFQYLVNQDNSIPRCDPKNLPPSFQYGTQINHLAYNLESFHGRMTLTSYRLFQSLMFDPVLPFWLYDSRHDERRTISGNLSRLSNEEKSNVEYHSLINQETQIGKIIIRYWVFK